MTRRRCAAPELSGTAPESYLVASAPTVYAKHAMPPAATPTSPMPPTTNFAHDVLRQERQPLDVVFSSRTVAVIGAPETGGSVRRTVLRT